METFAICWTRLLRKGSHWGDEFINFIHYLVKKPRQIDAQLIESIIPASLRALLEHYGTDKMMHVENVGCWSRPLTMIHVIIQLGEEKYWNWKENK
jgi:hypothetical protein